MFKVLLVLSFLFVNLQVAVASSESTNHQAKDRYNGLILKFEEVVNKRIQAEFTLNDIKEELEDLNKDHLHDDCLQHADLIKKIKSQERLVELYNEVVKETLDEMENAREGVTRASVSPIVSPANKIDRAGRSAIAKEKCLISKDEKTVNCNGKTYHRNIKSVGEMTSSDIQRLSTDLSNVTYTMKNKKIRDRIDYKNFLKLKKSMMKE